MLAGVSMRITDVSNPIVGRRPRPICTGTAEQVLEDLARFAAAGYSLVVALFDCPSHSMDELVEQIERAGRDLLPATVGIAPQGGWKPVE
jgi:hypothetical protein